MQNDRSKFTEHKRSGISMGSFKRTIKSKTFSMSDEDFPAIGKDTEKTLVVSSKKVANFGNVWKTNTTDSDNESSSKTENVLPPGWIQITLADIRKKIEPNPELNPKDNEPEMTPQEYHKMAHEGFERLLKIREQHDKEFIETYGYEYFAYNYLMPVKYDDIEYPSEDEYYSEDDGEEDYDET